MSTRPTDVWLRLAPGLGMAAFLVRAVAGSGGHATELAGAFDPAGTASLPVSLAAVLLPGWLLGPAGLLLALGAVLGSGWAAQRLARLAAAGPGLVGAAGLLPGLLLPGASPLGRSAALLLAAFALAGLAGAVGGHLQSRNPLVLLEVLVWSDLLALCSSDWLWVALGLCLALLPLAVGRSRGGVEAPLAVLVAGGVWGLILRALVEGGLGIRDLAPVADLGLWVDALLGISATIVLVVGLTLLLTGRAEYGLTVALAACGLVALLDLLLPGISAPAGLAVVAVLPALAGLAWRAVAPPLPRAGRIEGTP